jgi:hypothetical protein
MATEQRRGVTLVRLSGACRRILLAVIPVVLTEGKERGCLLARSLPGLLPGSTSNRQCRFNATGTHGFLATPTAVPAPSTLLLLGTGLAFGAAWKRIRRRSGLDRKRSAFAQRSCLHDH